MPARTTIACALFLALSTGAAFAGAPADAVRYFYENIGVDSLPEERDRFTGGAKAFFDEADRAWEEREEACIFFSATVDGQDYDEAEIAGTLQLHEEVSGGAALVTAEFTLFGEPRSIEWSLEQENGNWKVADIASPGTDWRLSELGCE